MNVFEQEVTLLLVEDNPADARLVEEAVKENALPTRIRRVENGTEALNLLYKRDRFADAARPDLVLLDLNMPGMDGRQVLAAIKSDERLRDIPVVVFTTSASEYDVRACYELHANSYVVKPIGLDALRDAMRRIEAFWLRTALLKADVEAPR